ncbi:MAG: cytochrome b/b6 domain-containing protein, partial [Burkholderiaceae bacterium]|nr:cytochrome b/b6 domain-containing protein [Burkholderiaceae bacterium]
LHRAGHGERVAAAGHASLYLLMASMPVLGWLSLSAAGKPIAFFGLQLPALMVADKSWAHDLKAMHETLGTVGYWLIGSHVMAALGHQWVLKVGLLNRMALGRQAAAG